MKKLFFALFALTVLVSCSDDDNEGPKKYVTSMTLGEGENHDVISFQYDENKNLKAYVEDGHVEYSFIYNSNNELLSITAETGSAIEIKYEDGKLSGYTANGVTSPIAYNEQTKMYIFEDLDIEAGLKGRDLGIVNLIGAGNHTTIDYNDSYKGPMYNVPTKNIFLLSVFLNLYYFVTTKPITALDDSANEFTTENTYDADGYITKMVLKSGTETKGMITYQYTEL